MFLPSVVEEKADALLSSRAGAGGAVADVVGVGGAASAKMPVWLHGGQMMVTCYMMVTRRLHGGYVKVTWWLHDGYIVVA